LTFLTKVELTRLTKLLGLIGSDHDGEVTNAARATNQFLQQRRLIWADVLTPDDPPKREPLFATWRTTCAKLGSVPS
jgi:hypothetical protein